MVSPLVYPVAPFADATDLDSIEAISDPYLQTMAEDDDSDAPLLNGDPDDYQICSALATVCPRPLPRPCPATLKRRTTDKKPNITKSESHDAAVDKMMRAALCLCNDATAFNRIRKDIAPDPLINFRAEFVDVLIGKSTSTLIKRSGSSLLFLSWALQTFPDHFCSSDSSTNSSDILTHVDESLAHKYLKFCVEHHPSSRAVSFYESLCFCRYEFEWVRGIESCESVMLKKLKDAGLRKKIQKPPKQELLIEWVRDMDRQLDDLMRTAGCEDGLEISEVQQAVMLGFVLSLVYLCGRCSDIFNSKCEPEFDVDKSGFGYFEVYTACCYVKNLQIASTVSGTALFIGHALSIDSRPWAMNFMAARRLAGLSASADECLCRTPLYDGSFAPTMVSPSDVTSWLRIHVWGGA